MDPRTKNKPSIDDSTAERFIEKLSVMDSEYAVRSIKTETRDLGEPVPDATVPQHPVVAALQDLPDLPQMQTMQSEETDMAVCSADDETSKVVDKHDIIL